jgi:hypothetical protein
MRYNTTNMDKNKKQWIALSIFIFLILAISIGFRLGYRFGSYGFGKVGYLSMSISQPLTSIYVDESKKLETAKDNEQVKIALSPTYHSVIISREGYFPWKKNVTMPKGGDVTLYPILVSQNASGQIITKNDPEYWKLRNQITSNKLPTKDKPLVSTADGTTVWVENNIIFSKLVEKMTEVLKPETKIRNLSFYKNRNDAVLFSTLTGIYMIEIESNGFQNFMPVYTGQSPIFIETDPNFIYVLDGENLMQVII